MPELDHVTPIFEFESLPGVGVTVLAMQIDEAINAPYRASFDLRIEDMDAELSSLLGDNAVLTLSRGAFERSVCGVVARIEETAEYEGDRETMQLARVVLAPALALGEHRRNTRMFQNEAVPDILETVLGELLGAYGREVQLDLEETYEAREYCLQYRESDLDFVQRLMAEEGIAYSFDHEGSVEVLRLTDRNGAFPAAATAAGDGAVQFEEHDFTVRAAERIHQFETRLIETATAVTARDADWTRAGHVVEAEASGEDTSGRVRERYEHGEGLSLQIGSYDEGVRRYQKNDAERQVSLRQEEAVAEARVGWGRGVVIGLDAGTTFSLVGHPAVGVDGDYLVTRIRHHWATDPSESEAGRDDPYFNTFECIPAETPWRPSRSDVKPCVHGVHPALVTGPSGEEIHVDEHGRIKVQFHWDRENPADETSSCWIRVKQEWAGASWGFWWVPRIGMEVVVQFVDGDPDRPLVTGCVFDGANATPYALPDGKTKSTIRSASSLGSDGFNELRFEDEAGKEEIFTHAQKDYDEVVENDHDTLVHHDQRNEVVNDQTQTIDRNQTERVDAAQTMTVGGNRTVHVKGNYDETVDATETRHVAGDVTESFGSSETRTISGNVTETIGGDETRDIGADLTESVSASHSQDVGAASTLTIAGSLTRSAAGGINTNTPAAQNIDVAGSWSITAQGGINMTAPGGITLMMPGGVTRADSYWELISGTKAEYKGFDNEGFVAKVGFAGIVIGTWIGKVDAHAHDRGVNLVDMHQEAGKANDALVKKIVSGCYTDAEGADVAT